MPTQTGSIQNIGNNCVVLMPTQTGSIQNIGNNCVVIMLQTGSIHSNSKI